MDFLPQPDQGVVAVYPCPTPGLYRPPRCAYDPVGDAGRVIVVDNGSHTMRAGWAGEASPGVVCRAQIYRPKPKAGPASRAVVGDLGPGLSGWDFGRQTQRYCFESDVAINMEGQEALLDWALLRMGLTDCSSHPLLLTETCLPPSGVRTQLAQLVFEAYGLPALNFVAAAPAAFYHHYHYSHHQHAAAAQQQQQQQQMWQQLSGAQEGLANVGGLCSSSSALVVCSGHAATYVVPVFKGQPQWGASFRCWAGGSAGTAHLQQLLSIRYPAFASGILSNWQVVEGMKEAFCHSAQDYGGLLGRALQEPDTAGGLAVRVQLPYTPPPPPAEGDAAAVDPAVRAAEMRARGKALAARRRQKQLEEKEGQLAALLQVQAQVAAGAAGAAASSKLLASVNMQSLGELSSMVDKLTADCNKLKVSLGQQSHASPAATPAAAGTPEPDAAAAAAEEAPAAPAAGVDAMETDTPVKQEQPDAAAAAAAAADPHSQQQVQQLAAPAAAAAGPDNDDEATDTDTDSESAAIAAAAATAAAVLRQQEEQEEAQLLQQRQQQQQQQQQQQRQQQQEQQGDAGEHSSSTVTDEGLCQQEAAAQEVLQQVQTLQKVNRQGSKSTLQEQQQQGAVPSGLEQQPPMQQPTQQQQQPQAAPLQQQEQPPLQQQQQPAEVSFLGVPDAELTADEIKVKRRQQLMEAGRLARERAALRKAQMAELKEQQQQYEDSQFAASPFSYLTALQQRHLAASARVEARKRRRLGQAGAQELEGLAAGDDGSAPQQLVGFKGRRRDEKHRERMRLIAQAAASKGTGRCGRGGRGSRGGRQKGQAGGRRGRGRGRGRGRAAAAEPRSHKYAGDEESDEDGFGDEAADWQVYRDIDRRGSDSDAEADEATELAWTTERLQQIGAAVAAAAASAAAATDDAAAAAAAARTAAVDAANNALEAAAAAVAGQLTRLVYQGSAAAAPAASTAPSAAASASALYPSVTPRQDLGFNPTSTNNLGGVFEGIDLNLLGVSHLAGLGGRPGAQQQQQLSSAEDYQLVLGVERIRVPELLYQPAALAGVDQAGLSEVLSLVFQRLPKHVADAVAAGGVVLTGGNACFPGFGDRLAAELASLRPPGQPMPVHLSQEPLLDAWRGAAALATGSRWQGAAVAGSGSNGAGSGGGFGDPFAPGAGAVTRQLYEEAGVDYLKEYKGFQYPQLP